MVWMLFVCALVVFWNDHHFTFTGISVVYYQNKKIIYWRLASDWNRTNKAWNLFDIFDIFCIKNQYCRCAGGSFFFFFSSAVVQFRQVFTTTFAAATHWATCCQPNGCWDAASNAKVACRAHDVETNYTVWDLTKKDNMHSWCVSLHTIEIRDTKRDQQENFWKCNGKSAMAITFVSVLCIEYPSHLWEQSAKAPAIPNRIPDRIGEPCLEVR